jgi:NNP family nitrate/nitrite transporter-like MFS transporter
MDRGTHASGAFRVRGNAGRTLLLATLAFFGGFAGVSVFGPLVPRFTQLMHLNPFQAGLLAAIANLTGSLLRIPFGAWADAAGGKRPFLVLLGLSWLGIAGITAVMGLAYPAHLDGLYPVLLLLGLFAGAGIATFSVGIAQVSYWYPRERQGGPLGTYAGLGNAAPGLFAGVLPVMLLAWGAVPTYAAWMAFLAAIAAVYAAGVHDAPSFQLRAQGRPVTAQAVAAWGQDLLPAGSARDGLATAAHNPATWVLVALYFTSFGGFLALTAWLPTFWHAGYHVSLAAGGILTLLFSLLTSLVRVPGGLMADRFSIRYALVVNLLVIAAGATLLATAPALPAAVAGEVLLALGMGLQNAVIFKLVPRYVPSAVGGASGWIGGLGAFGGFVIPPVMGLVAQAGPGGYAHSFAVFWILAAIDLAAIAWLTRMHPAMGRATRDPAGVPT